MGFGVFAASLEQLPNHDSKNRHAKNDDGNQCNNEATGGY